MTTFRKGTSSWPGGRELDAPVALGRVRNLAFMDLPDLLLEFYGRIPPLAEGAVDGLDADQLTWAPGPGAYLIWWLVWHLTRVQDHHVAQLLATDQIWVQSGPWAKACGLEPDPSNTGYGHDADDVRSVSPENAGVLLDYLAVVDARTTSMLKGLSATDLDRVAGHASGTRR